MNQMEEFLKIKSREEWSERRKEFTDLKPTKEVLEHLDKILGKAWAPKGRHADLQYPIEQELKDKWYCYAMISP